MLETRMSCRLAKSMCLMMHANYLACMRRRAARRGTSFAYGSLPCLNVHCLLSTRNYMGLLRLETGAVDKGIKCLRTCVCYSSSFLWGKGCWRGSIL
jgi:hypothetical protein